MCSHHYFNERDDIIRSVFRSSMSESTHQICPSQALHSSNPFLFPDDLIDEILYDFIQIRCQIYTQKILLWATIFLIVQAAPNQTKPNKISNSK